MNLKEFFERVVDTEVSDWNVITCWGAGSGPSYYNKFTVWNTGKGEFSNIEVDSHANIAVLKSDLSISFAWGLSHNDDFIEEWANKFPNKRAMSSYIDFFFNGALVYRDIIVAVDGGRCYIPLPELDIDKESNKIKRLIVPKQKYKLIKMVNAFQSTYDYDSYFSTTGIEIADERWPL
jgi:hypothetical protein